jgi:glycosyltransferase involved in cell wall biosynthesis
MRILFVAMPTSIHAARWIRHLDNAGHEIILFPPYISSPHALLYPIHRLSPPLSRVVRNRTNWCTLFPFRGAWLPEALLLKFRPRSKWRQRWFDWVIRRTRPDLIHSMEFQQAGYFCLEAKKRLGDRFPPWLATNYGSDIYLFGRLAAHKDRIKEILRTADFYSAECERDIAIARAQGLAAHALPVLPNGGGIDLAHAATLRAPGPPSSRRVIAVKGYEHFAGRALTALKAIELASAHLRGYRIEIYLASQSVEIEAELLAQRTGLDIVCLPYSADHDGMLRLHGRARISLGVGISDGASTSFLESLAMGSFPIQTCTACADEWVEDGVSGFIVPPDDPAAIAARLVRAVTDDALVDSAAAANANTAKLRLDRDVVRRRILDSYATIENLTKGKQA